MTGIRIVPTAALTATTIALVAFVLRYPTAALWAVVVALILALCGLFTLAAETIDLRGDLDDAERRAEALEDELSDREGECRRLHLELTEAQIAGGKVLPFPARGGPVPVADEPIPIHDRVLIDHWIEDVQNWGEDADR